MPVILVRARALEDLRPFAVFDLRIVRHHPIDVGARAAHSGPEEEEHVAGCLDEVGFLGASDGGFGEEDGVPEAGVGAVD